MRLNRAKFASVLPLVLCLASTTAWAITNNVPPGSNFDLSHWYLQLPTDNGSLTCAAGSVDSASTSQLIAGFTNTYFYTATSDGAMVFWAPVNGATTSGTTYPRSELREELSPGDTSVNWIPYGTHIQDATCKVWQVDSTTPNVIIGQIHAESGAALPTVKIYYENGKVHGTVKTNSNDDGSDYDFPSVSVGLSNSIAYEIKLVNGLVSVAINGKTNSYNIFQSDPSYTNETQYFKAGDYCQANDCTNPGTNQGARVAFYYLTHYDAPSITNQPASQTVFVGSNVTFSVGALSGSPPITYAWQFDNTPINNATNPTLTIPNVQLTNAGNYSVVVADIAGSVTSSNATLTVNATAPVASFTASPTNGPSPLAVTFTDTSMGVISNRFWNFGDGNTTNVIATSVVHTYSPGTYTVTLIDSSQYGISTNIQANCIVAIVTNTVSTASSPSAGGTTSGSGTYTNGSSVTVCATANSCYNFVNWTLNSNVVSTSACYTFSLVTNEALVANFALNQYTVATSSSPAAGGSTSGAGTYGCGSNVAVCATANSCYSFVNWTDQSSNVLSTSACYTFTVATNESVVANFAVSSLPANSSLTNLWSFTNGFDGANPYAGLVQGNDGNFYGTTYGTGSGPSANGTVFKISPGGVLTSLWSFTGGNDGANPQAGLVQGSDSNFYGTTAWGGASSYGTVFRISPGGSLTNLWSFTGGTDGANPQAGLVQGSDSNFYGTAASGGASGNGTVFRISPSGSLSNIWSFTGGTDGANPMAGLLQGGDGNFYGTTYGSGSGPSAYGTVFRMSPGGSLTNLWSFTGGDDGAYPWAALVQGIDSNFYGTASYGGAYGAGTVFRIGSSGSLTNLWSFTGGTDGANPQAGLVQGSDSNFYGTAASGGTSGNGTVFRISPSGSLTSLWSFTGCGDGANPMAGLAQGSDGNLYGTTYGSGNGPSPYGTVFKLSLSPVPPPVAMFTANPTSGMTPLIVSFTDTSSNSPTSWMWTDTNGDLSTSRDPTFTYANAGAYTVQLIACNAGGCGTNTAVIDVYSPFAWWQLTYFGSTNYSFNTSPSGDYTGTGMSNTNKFLAGFNPTNPAAYLRVISIARANGTNVVVTYLGASGDTNYVPGIQSRTNVLDFTTGGSSGSYTNGGWQDTGQTNILGVGISAGGGTGLGTVTNMTDLGGAAGSTTRYYRVRVLLP